MQLAVIGNPIKHSLSPEIHLRFAGQFGIKLDYSKRLSVAENFASDLFLLKQQGFTGCNITAPFKHLAYDCCDQLSQFARLTSAVNTIRFSNDELKGDNTDGRGLIKDINHNLGLSLQNKTILLIGAGGAAAGIIANLLAAAPKQVVICNRSKAKASALCKRFAILGLLSMLEDINRNVCFDLIINTIPCHESILKSLGQLNIAARALYYDLRYPLRATEFAKTITRSYGLSFTDGIGMLVEQAALSFKIWTGHLPDTRAVLASFANKSAG